MDGSDHRKLSVIGKSKTPHCLQKKYKMQVKDMSVNWYASKNAWMTGEIHHQIMSKLNNEMRLSNCHILYVCGNASSHQVHEYSHIKFLMLPPNATSIMQPLDQGIILSAKRRYKKKLAERYLACVENNKDANSLLKALDIVQATNMIAASWRGNLLYHHPELFLQSRVQTPCSRPCTWKQRIPYPPQHQMCGTGFKGG